MIHYYADTPESNEGRGILTIRPPGFDAQVVEIGDDYIKAFDDVGLCICEIRAIADMAVLGLTDDSGGQGLLESRLRGVRAKRDILLGESDRAMWPDRPMSEEVREAWKAYRQALRDLPESVTTETMYSVHWPEQP